MLRCQDALATTGLSIAQAVSELLEARAALTGWPVSVVEAAKRVAAQEAAEAASSTVAAAWDKFLEAKAGLASRTLKEYGHVRDAMNAHFGESRMLASLTGQELVDFISATTNGPTTANLRRRYLSAFWSWCARQPRRWCQSTEIESLEHKTISRGEVAILSPEQVKSLLSMAESKFPELVPWLAISLFAGLRQSEIENLKPSDITLDGIKVNGKTGRRFIAMPAPLAAWLAVYPVGVTVLPSDFRRKETHLRRLCGWRVYSKDTVPRKPPSKLPVWGQNCLRHTAASVAVGTGKNIEALVFEHGHSGGLTVLKKHYVGAMTKAEALAIWRMGPGGTELPLLAEAPHPIAISAAI